MGSGLDDYPRRNQDTEIAKQHVDLLAWLYFLAEGLEETGEYLEKVGDLKAEAKGYKRRNKYRRRVAFYEKEVQEYIYKLYN